MTIPVLSWRGGVLKSGLLPTTRHVLLTLACHMNDAGESCFPSVQMLVDETGLSKRALITHLKIAAEAGWILVGKIGLAGQRWSRNEYQIAWPDSGKGGALDAPPSDEKAVHVVHEGGARSDIKAVHQVHLISSYNSSKNSPAPSKARTQEDILWDHTRSMFAGISEEQMDEWEKAFPKLDIDSELTRIELWYKTNPKKHKRDVRRFITGWLARAFKDSRTPKVFVKQQQPLRPG